MRTPPALAGAATLLVLAPVRADEEAPPSPASAEEAPSAAPAESPAPAPPAPKPAAAAPAPPAAALAPDDPEANLRRALTLRLGPLAAAPIVLVAAQAAPIAGDDSFFPSGDAAERPGFRLRHARLGLGGDVSGKARFRLSTDLGGGDGAGVAIHDAWLGYAAWDELAVYAGARRVPYSRSALTGSGDSALIERPLAVRAMAPGNQVGVEITGRVAGGVFEYALALFNGLAREDQFYAGYVESYAPTGNRFDGIAYAARVGTEPLGDVGPTIDDPSGSPARVAAGAGLFWSDGGARDVIAAGGDVLFKVAGLHLLGEALWSRVTPESVPTQSTTQIEAVGSLGLVAEAGYMVWPRRVGLTARFEWIDPNQDIEDESDNWIFTGGASARLLGETLKAQADYTHREERAGISLSNDSLVLELQLHL
jgi:hypothetical protein